MSYQLLTQYNAKCYTSGRPYGITAITIHWWDEPQNHPSFDGVIATFTSGARQTSAHYVAEAGRVACLVNCGDRAWACGDGINVNSGGNDKSISIECNPRQSDGDYNTIAELIRDIRKTYGNLPLYPHNHWFNTTCPGTYDLARLDKLANGQSAPATPATPTPAPAPAPTGLAIDGMWGNATTKRLQQVLGTTADGIISGQIKAACNQNIYSAQWGTSGSDMVAKMSAVFGITDKPRNIGPNFVKALQRREGTTVDGVISPVSECVKAMQRKLNNGQW